jgi:DMSO reductase family type II enzyme heme b subunit
MMARAGILSCILLAGVTVGGCRDATPAPTPEVVVISRAALPSGPADPAWRQAPVHVAPLLLQDMVEPRQLQPTTREVSVRAIADGAMLAFRIDWADGTQDDRPGPARFSDAVAVQVPAGAGANLPAPQMGETGRGVEITLWRAAWQAVVDGRGDTIKDLYPRATVDHYPFEAAPLETDAKARGDMALRYAPARALGNTMGGPRTNPVQDLIAEGPGSLSPAAQMRSSGKGERTQAGWSVMIVRPLPTGLTPAVRSQAAFAVWEGSTGEAGARKMRTAWIPLSLQAKP